MASPEEIINKVASLMNDTAQTLYTDAAVLPYLDMALDELDEIFQHNNIPVTNQESSIITVKAGVDTIGFGTNPGLPQNLIEIQQLWERSAGVIPFTQVRKVEFIPRSHEDQNITQFLFWAWRDQEIRVIAATADNDIKLDYIQSIFNTPVAIADINVDLNIPNTKMFLQYKTAALCAQFIGENQSRAAVLNSEAMKALDRELGIPIKGRQAITTRRRPFMASYHRRGYV